jgi:hypothetical protein
MTQCVLDWLMEGDSVIRWQVMRDLADEPEGAWLAEQLRIPESGWGARFLEALRPDGTWPPGRWTDTVRTLLVVMDCGMPADQPQILDAARRFVDRNLTPERAADRKWLSTRIDLCHLGFWLRIGSYFIGPDERLGRLAEFIQSVQMEDGGWNCRKRIDPKTCHSSFHTTFNVLEGLKAAVEVGNLPQDAFRQSEARALEFMLIHSLYRSDKTASIIDERFTHLTFPSHWHYTFLRALDYMRNSPEIADPRLNDPVSLLESRVNKNGRWPVEKRIPGATHFDMELFGDESRWNTMRALRVFRARDRVDA